MAARANTPGEASPVVQTLWAAFPPRVATMTRGSLIWPLIGLICLVQGVLATFRDGWTATLSLVWLAVAVVAAACTAKIWRARVRLRSDGLEVRELRTSLYPWRDLVEVHNDGASHAIVLRYRDGSDEQTTSRVTFLPIPFKPGLLRRRMNPAFVDAPALISAGWQRYAPAPEEAASTEAASTEAAPETSAPEASASQASASD